MILFGDAKVVMSEKRKAKKVGYLILILKPVLENNENPCQFSPFFSG
jgi:hypothetical protein